MIHQLNRSVAVQEPPPASVVQAYAVSLEPRTMSLFERFPRVYAFFREHLFQDHSNQIAASLWGDSSPPDGSALLEIGCGPGFYSRRFAERYRQLTTVGIDCSDALLHIARERAVARSLTNCHFRRGNALSLEYRADMIDMVVSSRLFTVLPQREVALREMYRVLRPGGRFFIAEPRNSWSTTLPLSLLWMLAAVVKERDNCPPNYLEPRQATALCREEFGELAHSQPWKHVTIWWNDRYQFASGEK